MSAYLKSDFILSCKELCPDINGNSVSIVYGLGK